jgi:hypothetical protein
MGISITTFLSSISDKNKYHKIEKIIVKYLLGPTSRQKIFFGAWALVLHNTHVPSDPGSRTNPTYYQPILGGEEKQDHETSTNRRW